MITVLTGDDYFLGITQAVAAGAKCTRRQVGAIIVDENKHIVATGKNGSPPGHPECTDGACPRGQHYESWPTSHRVVGMDNKCGGCGEQWPCTQSVEPNSSYDTGPGSCIAVHAEANALLNRTVASVKGATVYVTDWPCDGCLRLLKGAQVARIVTPVEEWVPELS